MKKIFTAYYLYGILSLLYLGLTLFTPVDPDIMAQYNVSTLTIKLLLLTIAIPLVAIWGIAFYSYVKISEYRSIIANTKDGYALGDIQKGIGLLAIWLPVSSISTRILELVSRINQNLLAETVIVKNYLSLFVLLLAFALIYRGASKMSSLHKKQVVVVKEWLFWLLFVCASLLFIYLSLNNPARQFPDEPGGQAVYHLPDWLIVSTLIIPYLVAWYVGLRGAFMLKAYQSSVKGKLYASFFRYISAGLMIIVITSMLIRFVSAASGTLNSFSLLGVLLTIYLLLGVAATGYLLIARGAKQLKAIEEV